jgi:hypothetical protein
MYAVCLYGIVAAQANSSRTSSARGPKKRSPPNFSSFFCCAWLFYVIVFNYLANLHFQPLFVGIQARFYMQPNLLVVISSALMLFHIFRCMALSSSWVRFTVPMMFLLSAWQVSRTFPTVDHRCTHAIRICSCAWNEPFLRSKNDEVYRFGKSLLNSIPPHSLLSTLGDLQHNSVK